LLTSTATGPKRSVAWAMARATWAGSVTSASTAWRWSGAVATTAFSGSARRPKTVTFSPWATKACAIAAPMPVPPPVTRAWRRSGV